MSKFKKTVITNEGLNILNEAILNSASVTFTRLVTGNGDYDGTEDLLTKTELKSEKQSCAITDTKRVDSNNLKVQSYITNDEVLVGYYITEIGIYGKLGNGDEKLIAITIAELADYFPDKSTSPTTLIYENYLKINNCDNIDFQYTIPDGVYALKEDVDKISKPTYEEMESLENLASGEKIESAFGKIAKAIKDFINHIKTKATDKAEGHVKVTDSSAVTDSTGLALAATEKNASIDGTLAHDIAQINTNLIKIKVMRYTITNTKEEIVVNHKFYIGSASIKDDIPVGTILATIPTGLYSDGYENLPVESVGLYGNNVTVASEIQGDRTVQVVWIYI